MDNNTFGAQFNSNSSPTADNDQNNQFAPPPNNIFIRTMNSDMETLKNNGGSLPSFESPNASFNQTVSSVPNMVPPTVNNSTVDEPPNNPFANQTAVPPPITPTFNNQVDGIPAENIPTPPKKKKLPVWLLVVLGLIILGGGGFAAYKFIWPKFVQPKTPVVSVSNFKCGCDLENQPICTVTGTGASCSNAGDCTCAQVTTTTVVTLPPTPFIEIPSTADVPIAVSPLPLDFTNKSLAATVLSLIKTEVNKATPVNTLKPIRIDYKGQFLGAKEILAVLFKSLPAGFTDIITDKYAVYVFYGDIQPSLGVVIETNSPDTMKTLMANWEKKGMLDGAANMFIKPVVKPSTIAFKDRVLPIGGTARYITYKTANTELNYIIYNNYLIITTAKGNLNAIVSNLANR